MSDAVVNAQPENSGIMVADIPSLLSVYRSDTIRECWGRKAQIENEIRRVTTADEPSIEIARSPIHSATITVKGMAKMTSQLGICPKKEHDND